MKHILVIVGVLLMGRAFLDSQGYAPDGIWQQIFVELREVKILLWAIAVLLLANFVAGKDTSSRKDESKEPGQSHKGSLCPACYALLLPGARKCHKCGLQVCPKCRGKLGMLGMYCGNCGWRWM